MCGIAGFWTPKGLPNHAESALQSMLKTLHHRGPDGRGRHLDPARGLAMGHTRLSIIDLNTGHQPLFSLDRSIVLTANGEFYDYKPTRARFACLGQRFDTKSDSEVAVAQYQEQGLDFVHSLRGEFAFALYDANKERLILVRDRFGIKPLYFRVSDAGLHWASEIKALLANPDVPAKLSRKAALNQLMHTMVPGTTAFEGISALEPGTALLVERQGDRLQTRTLRYWDMTYPHARDHDPNPNRERYIDQTRERLIDAVRLRLEADVPVGCYLSGGIDSCSILGLSTAMQQSPVKAFTISFDHDAYDEASIAKEMAQAARADQELLKLGANELYGPAYVRTLWHAERTFYNTLGVAKWHMSRRVQQCGLKVVITGEGSDEMFGGYPFFKRDLFLHDETLPQAERDKWRAQLSESNKVFKGSILSDQGARHPAFDDLMGFTPSWIQPWLLTLDLVRPLLSQDAAAELDGYDPVRAIADKINPDQLRDRHPLDKAHYTWIKTMLEGQILTWGGDRVDMANSMESRPAFLDHVLAEFASTLPPSVRIHQGVEKWVLREAMKGVLPEVLYKREKFAFMAPPGHTDEKKRTLLLGLIDNYLSTDSVESAGLCDPTSVQSFVKAHFEGKDPALLTRGDIVVNHLLGLHVLHRLFVEGEAPPPVASC